MYVRPTLSLSLSLSPPAFSVSLCLALSICPPVCQSVCGSASLSLSLYIYIYIYAQKQTIILLFVLVLLSVMLGVPWCISRTTSTPASTRQSYTETSTTWHVFNSHPSHNVYLPKLTSYHRIANPFDLTAKNRSTNHRSVFRRLASASQANIINFIWRPVFLVSTSSIGFSWTLAPDRTHSGYVLVPDPRGTG